ncbi:MAG: hypothetical protein QM638_03475 [Nocardioides sp.]|uniref:hypothetical protein n=1 Tax=Nocardioides sp. TaxID=35761 RepID=UPI0039E21DD3
MIVKVNQIASVREADTFAEVDIAGFVVGDSPAARVLDLTTYDDLRRRMAGAVCVHLLGVDDAQAAGLVASLAPDYVEFTVVDPEKRTASLAQLDAVSRAGVPAVANGLFLLKDDLSLLDRSDHLDALVAAGVAYLQVEVDSLTDPENRISTKDRARIAEFCARYPVLLTDVCDKPVPDVNQRGTFLNLGGAGDPGHDHSQRRFSAAAAVRTIRGLPGT